MQRPANCDPFWRDPLRFDLGTRRCGELLVRLRRGIQRYSRKTRLHRLLSQGANVGKPHPVCGQYAGQRMDEHPRHPERL